VGGCGAGSINDKYVHLLYERAQEVRNFQSVPYTLASAGRSPAVQGYLASLPTQVVYDEEELYALSLKAQPSLWIDPTKCVIFSSFRFACVVCMCVCVFCGCGCVVLTCWVGAVQGAKGPSPTPRNRVSRRNHCRGRLFRPTTLDAPKASTLSSLRETFFAMLTLV
jgi:hypothetical protein